jgi:hypothetical protein
MERQLKQKRQRADEPPRANIDSQGKKTTRGEVESEPWESRELPSGFDCRLSKIKLTHGALREFNRRTRPRRTHPSPTVGLHANIDTVTPQDLARFARYGGPDLGDLRGVSLYELGLQVIVLTKSFLVSPRANQSSPSRRHEREQIFAKPKDQVLRPCLNPFDHSDEKYQEVDTPRP